MPEVVIKIGGREFSVACLEGEEHLVHAAAARLDGEASALIGQIGRVQEARLLLMSGLMLADKMATLEDRLHQLETRAATAEAQLAEALALAQAAPEKVEVPVVPAGVVDALAEIALRAEYLAKSLEDQVAKQAVPG